LMLLPFADCEPSLDLSLCVTAANLSIFDTGSPLWVKGDNAPVREVYLPYGYG
jgi:hypothetical protein